MRPLNSASSGGRAEGALRATSAGLRKKLFKNCIPIEQLQARQDFNFVANLRSAS
jgi:hypothetical protein